MSNDPLFKAFEKQFEKSRPDKPDQTPDLEHHLNRIGVKANEYRLELGSLAALGAVYLGLYVGLAQNPITAGVQLFVLIMVALYFPVVRLAVRTAFAGSRIRRRWDTAARHCGLPGRSRIARVERIWSGYRLRMRVSHGLSFDAIIARSAALAASMNVGSVKVKRDDTNASRGLITLVSRDPLLEQAGKDWPAIAMTDTFSLWNPILLGTGEHGDPVTVSLPEKNILIGGAPGAGKALALDTLVPTPEGWSTMAALKAGDRLFDENGAPCTVTDAWEIRHGRPCYELEFSDGSTIVADAEHQWLTKTNQQPRRVMTTAEIHQALHRSDGGSKHLIDARRYIVDTRPVASVPVRCIAVDSPSNLFLVGRTMIPTHNSAAMSMLIATAALDPSVKIYLIDGKEVEFAPWETSAEGFAYKIEEAVGLLARIQGLMDDRYHELKKAGLRKVERDRWPLHLVAIDELALFTAGSDRKLCGEFADRLRDIVARGRAAGVILAAATQKPQTDVVPSSLRDLFAFKWAMYCATPQASDTILGQGWASQGANAATIGRKEPGVGYLLAEDALPVRLRSFYLSDQDVATLADRAQMGRSPTTTRRQ